MKILLVDNFDSFVYNLYQYLGELDCDVDVIRNDKFNMGEIIKYDKIVISPGPGNPDNEQDFGMCRKVIEMATVPILGICLGHQGIISVFGGKVIRAEKPMHGKTSIINHDGEGIFKNVKNPLRVMRYHSLVGERDSMPACLKITATAKDGTIMAVQHKEKQVYGLQFHPESILAEEGKKILKNFLEVR